MSVLVWIGALFAGGVVAGLIVGRWWALLLAALVPLGFVPASVDSDGAPTL